MIRVCGFYGGGDGTEVLSPMGLKITGRSVCTKTKVMGEVTKCKRPMGGPETWYSKGGLVRDYTTEKSIRANETLDYTSVKTRS